MIIGISGKKFAGKDTICGHCINIIRDAAGIDMPYQWAYKMHIICGLQNTYASLFLGKGDSPDFNSQEWKDEVAVNGKTHRENLVQIGNDGRKWDADIWLRYFEKHVVHSETEACFVTGVRYPNEVAAIQQAGGKVLRLTRNVHEDQHESETALDGMQEDTGRSVSMTLSSMRFDAVLDNSNLTVDEANVQAWAIIKEWI